MERPRSNASKLVARLGALALLCMGTPVLARSGADLSARLHVDGDVGDWDAADAVFTGAEERPGDSAWSALQDLQQIFVTWDAANLYVAVTGSLGGHALILYIDHAPGGLEAANGLDPWRRALHFGTAVRPDAFLAVRDGQAVPELWLAPGRDALQRIPSERYAAAATFQAEAANGAMEAAIGWDVLFPDASAAINPDSLAPAGPMFVLPAPAASQGLRLVAVLVHADAGLGAADAAPDPTAALTLDPRAVVDVDRVARVDWATPTVPAFVRLGFAFQEQTTPRFVPELATPTVATGLEFELITFRAGDATQRLSRLVVPDRALALGFALRGAGPATLYVTATVASLTGERVAEILHDTPVACAGGACSAAAWVWDGRDANGQPVRGGNYVLRVTAGTSPGTETVRVQRTIAVVH